MNIQEIKDRVKIIPYTRDILDPSAILQTDLIITQGKNRKELKKIKATRNAKGELVLCKDLNNYEGNSEYKSLKLFEVYKCGFSKDDLFIEGENFCCCWECELVHISKESCQGCFGSFEIREGRIIEIKDAKKAIKSQYGKDISDDAASYVLMYLTETCSKDIEEDDIDANIITTLDYLVEEKEIDFIDGKFVSVK